MKETPLPEEELARTVSRIYELAPPVDVKRVARDRANFELAQIPLDVDGACLDLKKSGKKPTIIINKNRSETRIRFTIAHELGHVLIPWHIGDYIDTDLSGYLKDLIEAEANRFASELLLPESWVRGFTSNCSDPVSSMISIANIAEVSLISTLIKMIQCMEPGYVFAVCDANNVVQYSGKSPGTFASIRYKNSVISNPASEYSPIENFWKHENTFNKVYWWKMLPSLDIDTSGVNLSWREMLAHILHDVKTRPSGDINARQSINGIVSNLVDSGQKKGLDRGALISGVVQRMQAHATDDLFYGEVLKHQLFQTFVAVRVDELLKKRR